MKRLFYLIIGLFFPFSSLSLTAEFNPKTHFYQIEYTKAIEDGPRLLNIIFDSPIGPQKAEEVLRDQLNQAIKYDKPVTDIMAYAWYQKPGQDIENSIELKDGSSHLIYNVKTGEIQTATIYEKSNLPQPGAGKEIKASFDITTQRNSDGEIRIIGKTNLPNEMNLMINLTNQSIKYLASDKVNVRNGSFITSWFSNKGISLPLGNYRIEILSPFPDLQPESVKEIIGKDGENLTGKSVKFLMGVKIIHYSTTKPIK